MAKAPEKRDAIKRHLMAHPEDAMNISKLARMHGTTRPTVHAAMKEMGIRGSGLSAKSQMYKKAAAQSTHEPSDTPHHEAPIPASKSQERRFQAQGLNVQPFVDKKDSRQDQQVDSNQLNAPNLTIAPPPPQGQDSPDYDPLNVEHRKQMLADLATDGSGRDRRDSLMDLTRVEQLTGSRKDLGPGNPMSMEEHSMRMGRLMKAIGRGPGERIFKETFNDSL